VKKTILALAVLAIALASSTAFALAAMKAEQGVIQSLDPRGRSVTLADGKTFTVSPSVSTEPLREGDEVTILYEEKGGHNELTAFWIDSGRSGESG
jgi:Cu/Ag efflux protein CusF